MSGTDPTFDIKARQAIAAFLKQNRVSLGRERIYLVSYPRSGNTLVREYFSALQGRPQYSVYPGDVVRPTGAALTRALDHVDIIKSHQMPADDGPVIYLVRDGRNATLSFLYMSFLFGGHQFSRLTEGYEGIRYLDRTEGGWADHVAEALRQKGCRKILFVRYEDLLRSPAVTLVRMAHFMNAELATSAVDECLRRQQRSDRYARNPNNGYLYQPEKGSIYDILKRHRTADYWRYIFDRRCKRYFHEAGGTDLLLRFGYEASADWWKEGGSLTAARHPRAGQGFARAACGVMAAGRSAALSVRPPLADSE